MTRHLSGAIATLALLIPQVGSAQVYQFKTPPPPVSAQYAAWQFNDEPILVNGLIYYPTRGTRFFDGEIMSHVGTYRSVPIYADVTLEAHSVVYVPVGRNMMRGYERRREGELAGTTGSRTPAFPVEVLSPSTAMPRDLRPDQIAIIGTAGRSPDVVARDLVVATTDRPAPATDIPKPAPTHVQSIPRPRDNDGIWLEYAGTRWYSDGPAATFDRDRFVQIGTYRGFPVYRDKNRGAEEIWVRVVADGPVAPYAKRR